MTSTTLSDPRTTELMLEDLPTKIDPNGLLDIRSASERARVTRQLLTFSRSRLVVPQGCG